MLDIQEHSISEIEKHPVSRDQNPGSANADKGFHHNSLDEMQYFMQLVGLHSVNIDYEGK